MVVVMWQVGMVGVFVENQMVLCLMIYEEYFGLDFVDQFIDYLVGKDFEIVMQLFEDVGYIKENGMWVDFDGEFFMFIVFMQNNNIQVQVMKVFNDYFNVFGIQIEISMVSLIDYYQCF